MARPLSKRRLLQIEPQSGLAHLGVGPMTTEAAARKDRLYILVEIEVLRSY
jgi:hypothetical protein